jgi:tetratricopeptide (TPR) repeat protein
MLVKCTSCGAPQNNSEGQNCSFCGSIVIANELIQNRIDKLNANGNFFKLAEVAFEGGNFDEAINYYNRCLEIDSDFFEAWYKKGLTILKTSTVGNLKSEIAIAAFKQAIINSPEMVQFKKRVAIELVQAVINYNIVSIKHYNEFTKLNDSIVNLINKVNKTNEVIMFLLDDVGLQINEVKLIWGSIGPVIQKLRVIILGNLTNVVLANSIETSLEVNRKVIELWKKLEPSTVPAPKKTGCFIATAAMGSYDHPVVMDLRMFRDNWLLKRNWGVAFTEWYYVYGAKASKYIEKSVLLKKIAYMLIVKPLHIISKKLK